MKASKCYKQPYSETLFSDHLINKTMHLVIVAMSSESQMLVK